MQAQGFLFIYKSIRKLYNFESVRTADWNLMARLHLNLPQTERNELEQDVVRWDEDITTIVRRGLKAHRAIRALTDEGVKFEMIYPDGTRKGVFFLIV